MPYENIMYTIDKYSYFENDKQRNLPLCFRRLWLFNSFFWAGQKSIHVFFSTKMITFAELLTSPSTGRSGVFLLCLIDRWGRGRGAESRGRKSCDFRGWPKSGIDMTRKFEALMNKAWLLLGGLVYPKNNFQNYTVSKLATAPHLINWMFSNPDLILWVKTMGQNPGTLVFTPYEMDIHPSKIWYFLKVLTHPHSL